MDIFNMLKSFFGLSVDWSTLTLSGMLYQMFVWLLVFMIMKVCIQAFFDLIKYLINLGR